MHWWSLGLVGGLLSITAPMEASAQTTVALTWGVGNETCAAAEQPYRMTELQGWVMGYFSAANVIIPNHRVGLGTDHLGIMAEIKLECDANSSETFNNATGKIYEKLRREGN
jgi:hypothetical protein